MWDIIKKIINALMSFPQIMGLVKKSLSTGKIDPFETLDALSTISPETKKCVDVATQTIQSGGGIPQAVQALSSAGIDVKSLSRNLKSAGDAGGVLGNMLDKMQMQPESEVANFGKAMSDLNNWKETAKSWQSA